MLRAALEAYEPDLASATLPHMIALGDDSQDKLILETLERGFKDKTRAVRFINLAAQWKPAAGCRVALAGSGQQVETSFATQPARALGRMGDVAVPRGQAAGSKRRPTRGPRPLPCSPL